jgi:ABC-type glutathione transport system ATPase component
MTVLVFDQVSYRYGHRASAPAIVDDVSLQLASGEILGLVGESGCGKSTLARLAVSLLKPAAGRVCLDGTPLDRIRGKGLWDFRRQVQLVFQDSIASLNPRSNVRRLLTEPLSLHAIVPPGAMEDEIARLLDLVGLPADLVTRLPQELSGGQRQRVAIARAIAMRPRLLICDEPVSSLDVSVRAQILRLLLRLRAETGLGLLFISHDLSVVRHVADRVAVMRGGRIIESGATSDIWQAPQHPYTQQLLAAVPTGEPGRRRRHYPLETPS